VAAHYLGGWRIDVTARDGVTVPLSAAAIARSAVRALEAAGASAPASLAVILTNDAEMAELNEKHMGHEGATDVLSFPLLPGSAFPPHPGQHIGRSSEKPFVLPPGQRRHLGDVVISVDRAREQAEQGSGGQTSDVRWSVGDELRLLVIHGTLHICGWDHSVARERDAMRTLEQRLLSASYAPEAEHWRRYYEVTADRPAWETVRVAISNFAADEARPRSRPRFAVDLGAGAGRDSRELLRAGWRVLAIDREASGLRTLEARTAADDMSHGLSTQMADVAAVEVPVADLVNANLILPFLSEKDFWATWRRMLAALEPGGRVSAMVFGDRDEGRGEPGMTYVEPSAFRTTLEPDFEIEHWVDVEEDTTMALGQPHHLHRVEVVAKRVRPAPKNGGLMHG
jgi:rRNA maturation RNase YbeY